MCPRIDHDVADQSKKNQGCSRCQSCYNWDRVHHELTEASKRKDKDDKFTFKKKTSIYNTIHSGDSSTILLATATSST